MEKFSTWRDKGTGISPFIPTEIPTFGKKNTSVQTTISIISLLPIFLIKLPFLIFFTLTYSITGLNVLLKFIIQVLFGFNFDFSVDGVKRSQVAKLESYKPKVGNLIITNYATPLDGFIFKLFSGRDIVILVPDKSGDLYKYTPCQLWNFTFDSSIKGELVTELSKYKNSIVFLLVEGTSSNNKSILPFINLNPKYELDQFNIKSLIYKVSPNYFTMPIPYISKIKYLFELITNISKKQIKLKIYNYEKLDFGKIKHSYELNSLNSVKLNIDDKEKFVDYYFNYDVK
ncbi:unnamed protein product [Candida verbasci]|uniref:Phospholipid/glycerol acyltransferase domain-containing protein n=1 Tax=Candida verbasci TaxID=1227364 RepID=A0A9W4TVF7_9ASCO|nr:unnamed protein product [Candida verbasci]